MGVATAVAIGGLAISAGSTAMSFMNASEQKSKQRAAEAAAAAAMAEAKKKLGINYTDEMAVKKEPYELQREALLSAGAQAIEAGTESERGAATTAGKVMMAQNEAQAGIRTAMGAEMTAIEEKQIAEQSRLRDLGVQIDLGEVEGQQAIARDAEQQAAADSQAAWQGVTSTAQQGLALVPLFAKSGGVTDWTDPNQVSMSNRKSGVVDMTNQSFMNPVGARNDPSLAKNPLWEYNPFTL